MINQGAQVSESDILKHITQVICNRQGHCKYQDVREACVVCTHNKTGLHKFDNFKPKIPGISFPGESQF